MLLKDCFDILINNFKEFFWHSNNFMSFSKVVKFAMINANIVKENYHYLRCMTIINFLYIIFIKPYKTFVKAQLFV